MKAGETKNSERVKNSVSNVLAPFHPVMRQWIQEAFASPTLAQQLAWPAIAKGDHTLLLAPTGSGKTLAAFLVALNRIMFEPPSNETSPGMSVIYISPLKALGVDVERNLRAPLAGVRAVAQRLNANFREPQIGVRSGDTSSRDRQRLNRQPPDILITTPESLFLLLTSRARTGLQTVQTVIVDEIHSMVGTKRGAHLFTSLERLEKLCAGSGKRSSLQRIGLSATQRPLEEVARLLGGAERNLDSSEEFRPRPVTVVEAGCTRPIDLRIEVPVDDMSQLASSQQDLGNAAAGPAIPSIWPAIHPRLVKLIREHRSTMIFVNSRRLAERLATAINELAEEELALAHHGSIARATRLNIEDRLKRGQLPAIVATSSLELGIDMGAVDLVIQIEAPPSIASGIQRIGRAGHQVGGTSAGVVFPKFRGDLLACGAAARRMLDGEVEESFFPRNPLDVLAQQIVAVVAEGTVVVDDIFDLMRQAAPFQELPRNSFESVLDLLAGRYPSDEFSELRPRLDWDRVAGTLSPRKSTQRLAVVNAGTIPDRGLYGVFLANDEANSSRVGELDEEMVFETRPGDVFLLGASSWRVTDITSDKVYVVPAPGEPGKMPFWKGDGPGRPYEFGRAIGQLTRELLRMGQPEAESRLTKDHCLDSRAAKNLVQYLHHQVQSTGEAPSDRTIVVESFLDEIGDWRIALLSPFGARVHAPWAMAVTARLREQTGDEVDMIWTDDGMLFRVADGQDLPSLDFLFPSSDEIESIVVQELGATALFAGRFRENAARALLLPRRQPGRRTPLWLQRRRAADLLAVAARYPSFPMILETYRECLRDVFDLRGLKTVLGAVSQQEIQIHQVQSEQASPFASSLMFSYTANFIYNGDTPLAERRAQTLALDQSQLAELLGAAELREMISPAAVNELALELQCLHESRQIRDAEELQDLLRRLGDLTHNEIKARCQPALASNVETWLTQLVQARKVIEVRISGESRYVAVEDAARLRDALGIVPPAGLPSVFLETTSEPLVDLISRYARTHLPFHTEEVAQRFGLGTATAQIALEKIAGLGRLLQGEFLPGRRGREWTDPQVLRLLKRRSLAQLRKEIEPVEQAALVRFMPAWQFVRDPRRGLDGLLDAIELLQGLPLPLSALESDILPSRVHNYQPSDLDELCAAGEVIWRGFESLGADDAKIAIYLTDHVTQLAPDPVPVDTASVQAILELLDQRGALFFDEIAATLGGFRNDVLQSLWQLVWAGHLTNDTFGPLRSRRKQPHKANHRPRGGRFRSRRASQLPGSEGRWARLPTASPNEVTSRSLKIASQLIQRYGVLTREMVHSESIRGGFARVYPVLKAMEEAGKIRRGYFVAGLGAAQFAAPGAEDRLRHQPVDQSKGEDQPTPMTLAATDPANPFGAALSWPDPPITVRSRPQRVAGARVMIAAGQLLAYLGRTGRRLVTFLPEDAAEQQQKLDQIITCLKDQAKTSPVLLNNLDGREINESPLTELLCQAGFQLTSRGLHLRGSS